MDGSAQSRMVEAGADIMEGDMGLRGLWLLLLQLLPLSKKLELVSGTSVM